jgi:NADPH:quinone reductase-like Zn-dependent oxidoreductase
VEAIALNAFDPLYIEYTLGSSGRTVGNDFAGTVVEIGSEVPKTTNLRNADRVAGFLQGACSVNERPGAFANIWSSHGKSQLYELHERHTLISYIYLCRGLVWKIPNNIPIEQAAGVSLVALTAAQAIWYRLAMKAPFIYDCELVLKEHPGCSQDSTGVSKAEVTNVFMYGASTTAALYAAQMVRLSAKAGGRTVRLFGTASRAR